MTVYKPNGSCKKKLDSRSFWRLFDTNRQTDKYKHIEIRQVNIIPNQYLNNAFSSVKEHYVNEIFQVLLVNKTLFSVPPYSVQGFVFMYNRGEFYVYLQ